MGPERSAPCERIDTVVTLHRWGCSGGSSVARQLATKKAPEPTNDPGAKPYKPQAHNPGDNRDQPRARSHRNATPDRRNPRGTTNSEGRPADDRDTASDQDHEPPRRQHSEPADQRDNRGAADGQMTTHTGTGANTDPDASAENTPRPAGTNDTARPSEPATDRTAEANNAERDKPTTATGAATGKASDARTPDETAEPKKQKPN